MKPPREIRGRAPPGRRGAPLHILFLTDGGTIGGCAADARFLEKLVAGGYRVSYAYLKARGREIGIAGLDHYHLGYDGAERLGPAGKLALRVQVLARIRALVHRLQPDVLHAGWIPTLGFCAALTGYRPLLLMPSGSDVLILPRQSAVLRAITRFVIRRADLVTCDAEAVKQEIVRIGDYPADRVVTFPWGVELGRFHPSKQARAEIRRELGWADNPILLMTRNHYPVYRVDHFIRALPDVFSAAPEARALLVGEGDLRGDLEALAKSLGVADRVRFMGFVPNAKLPSYLAASDVYVSTSASDGTSMSMLEAFATGLPVLVTDVPSILEWVRPDVNGVVVPRGDVAAIARGLSRLLADPAEREAIGRRNLALARERANWDDNFAKLEAMYAALVDAPVRRPAARGASIAFDAPP